MQFSKPWTWGSCWHVLVTIENKKNRLVKQGKLVWNLELNLGERGQPNLNNHHEGSGDLILEQLMQQIFSPFHIETKVGHCYLPTHLPSYNIQMHPKKIEDQYCGEMTQTCTQQWSQYCISKHPLLVTHMFMRIPDMWCTRVSLCNVPYNISSIGIVCDTLLETNVYTV